MQDDSGMNSASPKKSNALRTQSSLTDSFRMAASVLGSNSTSKKAYTLTIPKVALKDKEEYKKQPECQICFTFFGKFGQHHCRVCANAVCSSCSYSTINKGRACDKCAYHHSDFQREKFKQQTIRNLTFLSVEYLTHKYKAEEQLKGLEAEIPKQQAKIQQKKQLQEKNRKQNQRLQQIAQTRRNLQAEIQKIKNS